MSNRKRQMAGARKAAQKQRMAPLHAAQTEYRDYVASRRKSGKPALKKMHRG